MARRLPKVIAQAIRSELGIAKNALPANIPWEKSERGWCWTFRFPDPHFHNKAESEVTIRVFNGSSEVHVRDSNKRSWSGWLPSHLCPTS